MSEIRDVKLVHRMVFQAGWGYHKRIWVLSSEQEISPDAEVCSTPQILFALSSWLFWRGVRWMFWYGPTEGFRKRRMRESAARLTKKPQ